MTALVAFVLLTVISYVVIASNAIGRIALASNGALLGALDSKPARALDALSDQAVRTAMAAEPLEQRTFNVAMVREAQARGDQDHTPAWMPVLTQLGWRDTLSLQNMLYTAAALRDLPRILDVGDALLRRRKLMEQMIPVMALIEADPRLHVLLVERLAAAPSWRDIYLGSTTSLRDRDQLLARYATIRALLRHGVHLEPNVIAPNVSAFDAAGLPTHAFALWRTIRPRATRPLDDINFVLASSNYRIADNPLPFQWQLMTGDGFSTSAVHDGNRTSLSIDWDGRGVPVFAQQQTSGPPGRYTLAVTAPSADAADLTAIAFRLMCDDAATAFQPAGGMLYATAGPVPCAFPVLQITGDVQPSMVAHRLVINQMMLTALSPEKR